MCGGSGAATSTLGLLPSNWKRRRLQCRCSLLACSLHRCHGQGLQGRCTGAQQPRPRTSAAVRGARARPGAAGRPAAAAWGRAGRPPVWAGPGRRRSAASAGASCLRCSRSAACDQAAPRLQARQGAPVRGLHCSQVRPGALHWTLKEVCAGRLRPWGPGTGALAVQVSASGRSPTTKASYHLCTVTGPAGGRPGTAGRLEAQQAVGVAAHLLRAARQMPARTRQPATPRRPACAPPPGSRMWLRPACGPACSLWAVGACAGPDRPQGSSGCQARTGVQRRRCQSAGAAPRRRTAPGAGLPAHAPLPAC